MRFVFLGPPGVGKGTQAKRLSALRRIPHIATGDMLRHAVRSMSSAGLRTQSLMDRGELVPDELVIEIVEERLAQTDVRNGFILDGFPRTRTQAEALETILEKQQVSLSKAFYFDAPESVVVERISRRRTCKRCGANFHIKFLPPRSPGVCDHCSGELFQRRDDAEQTVRERLRVYQDQTRELVEYYLQRNLLIRIDADRPPDRVFEDLVEAAG
jgi:adenylate kinase